MNIHDSENELKFKKFDSTYKSSQQRKKIFILIVASSTIITSFVILYLFFTQFISGGATFLGERIPFIATELLLPVVITLTIISALILKYLQPSPEKNKNDYFDHTLDKLKYIENYFDKTLQKQNNTEITEEDKKTILANIQKNIESESFGNYAESILDLVKSQSKTQDIEAYFYRSSARLSREVNDLAKRGNINLVLGIITTLVGLMILAITAFSIPQTHDMQNFIFFFTPRLSLVIMIEIFSYFFLKLYRQNLYEIKYFQNELTNIELIFFSTYLSMQTADCQQVNIIACKLAETDRNANINRRQTTAETENDREKKNNESILIQLISKLVKKYDI